MTDLDGNIDAIVTEDNRTKELLKEKIAVLKMLDCIHMDAKFRGLKPSDMEDSTKDFTLPFGQERRCDMLYKCATENTFFLLLEAQSYVDCTMMWRIEEYICGIKGAYFNRLYDSSRKKNYVRNDINFDLPEIIPIIYYNGSTPWKIPNSCYRGKNKFEIFQKKSCLSMKYFLIDIQSYSNAELEDFPLLIKLLFTLEQMQSKIKGKESEPVIEFGELYHQSISALSTEEKNILNKSIQLLGDKHKAPLLDTILNIKKGDDTVAPVDEMFEKIKINHEQMIEEIAKFLDDDMSDDEIIKKVNCSQEKIDFVRRLLKKTN